MVTITREATKLGAVLATAALLTACFGEILKPPTDSAGSSYVGTGEGIYLDDIGDGDPQVVEGDHRLTIDQALQAAGDRSYADYRAQIARHNAAIYQANRHRRMAWSVAGAASLASIVTGIVFMYFVAPATNNAVVADSAYPLYLAGVIGGAWAMYEGEKDNPPYVDFKVPGDLQHPDHLRQQLELYNERIHAPANAPPLLHQQSTSNLEMR